MTPTNVTTIKKLSLEKIIEQIKDDPVRPHIPGWLRDQVGDVFALGNNNTEYAAIICVAYTNGVATTEEELCINENPNTAMFYTVWSNEKGAGRAIINEVYKYIFANRSDITRYVTLSPPTDMAKRFHLNNGAMLLQKNSTTVNYEYLQNSLTNT